MPRKSCDRVVREEHATIKSQRVNRGALGERKGFAGLALSGDGIRSASFAIERVRADFGVFIEFNANCFNDLAPGYALATVRYPGRVGKLIVIKSSTVAGMPIDTAVYKIQHADFPNQNTADQFFSERQFEAYREIGYQIAKQMLKDAALRSALEQPRQPQEN